MPTRDNALPPRAWDVDCLFILGQKGGERAQYMKAVPVLILEKWVQGDREPDVANCIWTKHVAKRLVDSRLVAFADPRGYGRPSVLSNQNPGADSHPSSP